MADGTTALWIFPKCLYTHRPEICPVILKIVLNKFLRSILHHQLTSGHCPHATAIMWPRYIDFAYFGPIARSERTNHRTWWITIPPGGDRDVNETLKPETETSSVQSDTRPRSSEISPRQDQEVWFWVRDWDRDLHCRDRDVFRDLMQKSWLFIWLAGWIIRPISATIQNIPRIGLLCLLVIADNGAVWQFLRFWPSHFSQ